MKMLKNLHLVSQRPYKNLCWAACIGMIVNHVKKENRFSLEQIVKKTLNSTYSDANFDSTRNYSDLVGILKSIFKISCDLHQGYYNKSFFLKVKSNIDRQLPIMAGIRKNGFDSDGHLVLIIGYTTDSYIFVDPFVVSGVSMISQSHLADGYEDKKCNLLWYNFESI